MEPRCNDCVECASVCVCARVLVLNIYEPNIRVCVVCICVYVFRLRTAAFV